MLYLVMSAGRQSEIIMTPVMLLCRNCRAPYEADHLYCAACGSILPHALEGNPLDMTFQVIDPPAFAEALQWGTGYFHHRAKLSLRLENDTAIPIPLSAKTVVLGRGIELS